MSEAQNLFVKSSNAKDRQKISNMQRFGKKKKKNYRIYRCESIKTFIEKLRIEFNLFELVCYAYVDDNRNLLQKFGNLSSRFKIRN